MQDNVQLHLAPQTLVGTYNHFRLATLAKGNLRLYRWRFIAVHLSQGLHFGVVAPVSALPLH